MKEITLLFRTVLSLSFTSIYSQSVSALRCRLSGTPATQHEGRLEVYHKHSWRPVCDNMFGDIEARVVCFSLGFPKNCGRVVSNSYGPAVGRVLQAAIRCDGSEPSLGDCRYRDRSREDAATAHRCSHSTSLVAVSCQQCHATARRLRRNVLIPHSTHTYSNSDASSDSSSGSSTFWMGGLFIFFFFAWVVIVMCCVICHCYRRRARTSENGAQVSSHSIFMTPASGVDNAAVSSNEPDITPLAGLPSYDDVIAHSDIYKRVDGDTCLPPYSAALSQRDPNDRV